MYVVWTDAGMQAGAVLDLLRYFAEYLTRRSLQKTPLHCSAYISKHLRFVQYKMIGQLNCVVETTLLQPANQSDHMQNKTQVKVGRHQLEGCHSLKQTSKLACDVVPKRTSWHHGVVSAKNKGAYCCQSV